jgi:hypothetical protein
MCNDYRNHIPCGSYLAAFSQTRIPGDQAEAGRRLADAQRRMLETAPRRDYRGRSAEQISPLSLPLGD